MVFPVSPALSSLHLLATRPPRPRRKAETPECRPAVFSLASVPQNPRPEGLSAGMFRTRDGVNLRIAIHRGPAHPRGTVVLLQGRGDFIEKYYEVIGDLVARGFAVATFDWRGQGGSQRLLPDPSLNHLARFDDCVQDLVDLIDAEVLPNLPGPCLALAHSMGAAVLLHALAHRPDLVERAALTAPMVEIARQLRPVGAEFATRWCRTLGLGERPVPAPRRRRVGATYAPGNLLTSDEERYLRSYHVLAAAPHLAVGRPTIGWVSEAFRASAALRRPEFGADLRTPLLVVAGDLDCVTSTPAAAAFARGVRAGAMLALPSCAHDVLMERDPVRDAFWRAFDSFAAR
ncbi:MAG: alpha/beta hydrolase [Burkholderiales bacterium]|nr:alpha/beta hydrolase [Burkholderiales bacterium]